MRCCIIPIAAHLQFFDPTRLSMTRRNSHTRKSARATGQLPVAPFKPVLGSFAEALWIISISRSNVSAMRG